MKISKRIGQSLVTAESHIGISFNDITILEEAITHSSFANENKSYSNERLEFLGDSVLGLFISGTLMDEFPNADEGFLTKLRSKLVCKETNQKIAKRLKIDTYLLVGGAAKRNTSATSNVYADAFEAIVGAIYTDQGQDETFRWLWTLYGAEFRKLRGVKNQDVTDNKSKISEMATKLNLAVKYEVMDQVGPDNAPIFDVAVYLGSKLISFGQGPSRKAAEQDAAGHALKKLDLRLYREQSIRGTYDRR